MDLFLIASKGANSKEKNKDMNFVLQTPEKEING
jgi:hypothetical protein